MPLRVKLPPAVLERVEAARKMSTTEDALDEILNIGMEELGRVPAGHFPRLFEYPWILDQILKVPNLNSVADIGAGVSPLPVTLAKRGVNVYTFDASETVRTWEKPNEWNAWGYLDYSVRYKNIRSFNAYFKADSVPDVKYDVICSVSVVEHTPKSARVDIWNEAAKALSENGRLIFSIDLERNSNNIWNFVLGKVVEKQEIHGKIQDVHEELRQAGFVVETQEVLRGLPMSRIDILFFVARRA
jgi:2-polyprenyl-3-methyl-5-hydroxy-6-metoxy-1,4-benzoquinol methylase